MGSTSLYLPQLRFGTIPFTARRRPGDVDELAHLAFEAYQYSRDPAQISHWMFGVLTEVTQRSEGVSPPMVRSTLPEPGRLFIFRTGS